MRAILAGEHHPAPLAHTVSRYDLDHQQISAYDRQLDAHLATCAEHRASEALPPVLRPRQGMGGVRCRGAATQETSSNA